MTQTFFIAGVQHHEYKQVLDTLHENQVLTLDPEPTNKYDPNAVRILTGSTMLGYVPAKFSPSICAMLEIYDNNVECKITTFDSSAKPWEMIQVTISPNEDSPDE